MTVARFYVTTGDHDTSLVDDLAVSVPDHTTAVYEAAHILVNLDAPAGTRVRLWKDVDLVSGLDRFGDPHADLLMGDGGWIRVLPELAPDGQRTADHVRSDAIAARWIKPLDDDGLWALVDCAFYVACDNTENPDAGPFYIEQEVEYLVCHDPGEPGGTEKWATYEHVNMGAVDPDADPEAARDEVAASDDVPPPNDAEWNQRVPGYQIR